MSVLKVVSPCTPSGDQLSALDTLTTSIQSGNRNQTHLGVTGSGKTYTMAKLIGNVQKPTLVLTHNKAFAAQLYREFNECRGKVKPLVICM